MSFQAVLFDMDGVLVDTEAFYNKRRIAYLLECGLPTFEDYDFSGYSNDQMWEVLIPDDPDRRHRLQLAYRDVFCPMHPTPWKELVVPGVHELLRRLKQKGISVALCSSSDRDQIEDMLSSLQLKEYFDVVLSGADVIAYKPDPAIYLEAARRLKVSIADCIVVEDSPTGIAAGISAGAYVVARKVEGLDQQASSEVIEELLQIDSYFC